MNAASFDLFLFSKDARFIAQAVVGGAAGVVVDWELRGKEARQRGADTQINNDSPADLERVRASTRARVLCRINAYGDTTAEEVETAIGGGTDEILLPMVRSPAAVEDVLDMTGGRCGVGILVETLEALEQAEALARLPLSRVSFTHY